MKGIGYQLIFAAVVATVNGTACRTAVGVHERGAWKAANTQQQQRISSLASFARAAFHDAPSLLLLHDQSAAAHLFLDQVASTHTPTPLALGDLRTPNETRERFQSYCTDNHNDKAGITMVVFSHYEVAKNFLRQGAAGWVKGPLLLVSLDVEEDARSLLREVQGFASSALLRAGRRNPRGGSCNATATGPGELCEDRFALTTFMPFDPPEAAFRTQWFEPQSYPSRSDLLRERFTNFHGHRLNIGALTDDFPLVFYADASKTTITGLAVMMLQELAGALNLTFSLEAATSRGITSLSWDGVARKMAAYRRDLIINGLPLAWDLARALDVSLPVLQTSYGIGLKTPVTAKRWETIAYPFGGRVWLALGVALVALALVFHGVARNTGSTVYVHKADVLSTLLWLSRTLVNQSVAQVPDVPGSRTLLCFWWLTALVITASYMGNLIAFLTVSAQPARMKTLEELAASGFPLSVNRGRFLH
ncbi:uncharacterized protein [Penaeus vannamei]|uniref:uncharacterized protein n=1 Tax=Penaeus vannamei TaxID=6689 RepID=UPI00387F6644